MGNPTTTENSQKIPRKSKFERTSSDDNKDNR